MKSYYTTTSLSFFALFFAFCSANLCAQENGFSPYSTFGLGNLNLQSGIPTNSMGGVSTAMYSTSFVNPNNPASYSSLLFPVFDIGFKSEQLTLSSTSSSVKNNTSQINNAIFGFPFKKNMGLAFGILPYSQVGYAVQETNTLEGVGQYSTSYAGDGGLNKAFVGINKHFEKKEKVFWMYNNGTVRDTMEYVKHSVSLGANFNFLFGTINRTRRVFFDEIGSFFSRYSNENVMRGGDGQFGFLYKWNLKENIVSLTERERTVFSLGATYSLGASLNNESVQLIESYGISQGQEVPIDTISLVSISDQIVLPQQFSVGASLKMINARGRVIDVGVDYSLQDWTGFSVANTTEGEQNFGPSQNISVGLELLPDLTARLEDSFLKRTTYRVGARMNDSYLRVSDTQISETSISAGFSVPLTYSRSNSKINFGIEFGSRGSTDGILVEEKFSRIYLGVSLSPDYYRNVWFRKRKYN